MPRILLLSDAASEHTQKWALGLAGKGVEIGLFSFNRTSYNWFEKAENIHLLFQPESEVNSDSILTKISYLKYTRKLKACIRQFKPDVVHAHYATSYGLVARLVGFHPFVISAWGTDVMRFPQQNAINKKILKNNFEKADAICATSGTIRSYIHRILDKEVTIIPFGVDVNTFSPAKKHEDPDTIVIGCIKSLEEIYRIDVLIHAFRLLTAEPVNSKLKLLIVGSGSKEQELKDLCRKLEITDSVEFAGKVKHSEVQDYFNKIDVFANLSEYESFGVSVIEAMACEKAVVVTNVGGLKEIVDSEAVGKRVEVGDIKGTKEALEAYIVNESLRKETGKQARRKVEQHYNWQTNLEEMIALYKKLVNRRELQE